MTGQTKQRRAWRELTDQEWERIAPLIPPPMRQGKRKTGENEKTSYARHGHKRRSLAVPLSFLTQRPLTGPDRAALPAALPDALRILLSGTAFSRWRSFSVDRAGCYFSVLRAIQDSILSFLDDCVKFLRCNLVENGAAQALSTAS